MDCSLSCVRLREACLFKSQSLGRLACWVGRWNLVCFYKQAFLSTKRVSLAGWSWGCAYTHKTEYWSRAWFSFTIHPNAVCVICESRFVSTWGLQHSAGGATNSSGVSHLFVSKCVNVFYRVQLLWHLKIMKQLGCAVAFELCNLLKMSILVLQFL